MYIPYPNPAINKNNNPESIGKDKSGGVRLMLGAGGPELPASACPSIIALIKKHSAVGANIFIFLTIWGRIISAKVMIYFK